MVLDNLYVNSALMGTFNGFTLNANSLGSTTQNYLGKSQFDDPYLPGSIDDFRIYTRVLTPSEITALYTRDRAGRAGVADCDRGLQGR